MPALDQRDDGLAGWQLHLRPLSLLERRPEELPGGTAGSRAQREPPEADGREGAHVEGSGSIHGTGRPPRDLR